MEYKQSRTREYGFGKDWHLCRKQLEYKLESKLYCTRVELETYCLT